jgi:predicted dehydrogenase
VRLFAYGLLSVLLVLYLAELGLSDGQSALLLTLTLLGDTAISLWITSVADRVGRRRMLLVGAALMLLAGLMFASTGNFFLLLLAATIGVISPSGNEVGPFLSVEQAALSQIVPGGQRTSIFAWYNLIGFAGRVDTEVTYICDVDEKIANSRADGVAQTQGRRPKIVKDMRKVFEDAAVDIVSFATPNHWHALGAIWAMQAKKDVYVEKPVSHNVSEGRRMVEAARKYACICQCGTQSRSNPGMRAAIEFIRAGKLGEVKLARGLCYKGRGSIGPKGTYKVPTEVDYDLWSGPAPIMPLTRPKLHYDWHWMWAYGNGDLGNQGIHQMDICRWGLGVDDVGQSVQSYGGRFGYIDAGETANTQVNIHNYGQKRIVFEVRGLSTKPLRGASVGVIFYGSEGYFVSPNYKGGTAFDQHGEKIETFSGGDDDNHYANFIKAVRSRKHTDLNGDILDGHLSSALCHLGNISYLLGSRLSIAEAKEWLKSDSEAAETFDRLVAHLSDNKVEKSTKIGFGEQLKIDPAKEMILGNEAAAEMLSREYRKPFVVPGAGQV